MPKMTDSLNTSSGVSTVVAPLEQSPDTPTKKPTIFWLIILAIAMALFLSALEATGVSTALPTIVEDIPNFRSQDFIWVGSAYALAGTAFLPLSGSLAQIFGRRPVLQGSLVLFMAGSAICGWATSSSMLVAGRTVQGMGGGGITMLANLIMADLTTLQERGRYNAFLSIAWSVASVIGPPVCGALAEAGQWRWVFWLNIPLSFVVLVLLVFFLKLKTPRSTLETKLKRIDYIGNILIIGSTSACVLALTWGGVVYDWSSYRVLVPLLLGVLGMAIFVLYEAKFATEPTTPSFLFANRTSSSGYYQTFFIHFLLLCFIYYAPVYFQAVKLHDPREAGADLLGLAVSLAPSSIIVGLTVAKLRCFRPQIWIGWVITIIGLGCMSLTTADSSPWLAIGLTIIVGSGIGTVYTCTMIATLSVLPVEENARAIAAGMFLRMFGQIWGITIGGAIIQNQILDRLPSDILEQLPAGMDVAYGSISLIKGLSGSVRYEVQQVFAESLAVLWQALAGIAGVAFLVSLLMRGVHMNTSKDDEWGHETKNVQQCDPEDKPSR